MFQKIWYSRTKCKHKSRLTTVAQLAGNLHIYQICHSSIPAYTLQKPDVHFPFIAGPAVSIASSSSSSTKEAAKNEKNSSMRGGGGKGLYVAKIWRGF